MLDPGVQVCPHCGARYVGLVTTDGSKFCRQCEGWWVGTHRAGDAEVLPPARAAADVLAASERPGPVREPLGVLDAVEDAGSGGVA